MLQSIGVVIDEMSDVVPQMNENEGVSRAHSTYCTIRSVLKEIAMTTTKVIPHDPVFSSPQGRMASIIGEGSSQVGGEGVQIQL